jgi:integrase
MVANSTPSNQASRKLTKAAVEGLAPGQILWDADVKGFGVRCQRRDRVYILKYRAKGQQRWFTIGRHGSPWTVDLARKEARRILGLVASGHDPALLKQTDRNAQTVAELADLFLAEHVIPKAKERTGYEYRRQIERVIKPELGRWNVDEITGQDIRKLHLKFRATPYQANRLLALLSKMFSWSGRRGDKNPCVGLQRFGEEKRRRYLSTAELGQLGEALKRAERDHITSPYVIAALRLLIFTGARLNEVLTLRWDHLDLERGYAHLPDSKTGQKTIYLNPPALSILSALPRAEGNPFVIVGERSGRHLVNAQKPWRKIRALANLPDLRLHDLRHSFASVGAGVGLGLPVIGGLLGHSQSATTQRYAHLAADPLRAASDLIATQLSKAMGT